MTIPDLQVALDSLEARFQSLLETSEKNISDRDAALSSLKRDLEDMKAERDACIKKKEEAENAAKELKQQITAKEAEITYMKEAQKEADKLKKQVAAKEDEIARIKESQKKVNELERQLELSSVSFNKKQSEAIAASEEAELTLLQLHQVQEELEYYFFQSRCKDKLLKSYQAQQKRVKELLSMILTKVD